MLIKQPSAQDGKGKAQSHGKGLIVSLHLKQTMSKTKHNDECFAFIVQVNDVREYMAALS